MVAIHTLTHQADNDSERWDQFVIANNDATFFHRAGWMRVIADSIGHRPHYLYAEQDGEVTGVLPLFEVKSLLFGHSLVSTPFCVYGGVVAANDEARQALLSKAQSLAEQLGVDYLELRHRQPQTDGWPSKSKHSTFRRLLDPEEEPNLMAMKRKQRAVIRQSIKNEHEAKLEQGLDNFFDIYSTSVRNLGTPVFSRKFFEALQREFGDDCEVVTIFQDKQPRSSLMSFYFRDEVLPYYGGGLPESRGLKSMDFMYWDQIRRAVAKGFKTYDFGRSKNDSGPYNYKRHWGFTPEPLVYEYHLVKADQVPDISPNNPKYKYFISAWQKLPLKLSQLLGPVLSKYLG
ncbi:FemAB family XrtA/PEP-CTERM system-associated protein [Motiliproteus sp.]|uniref:FemAB family XrtA/PEP-CTERM system-associated protein n=1 Tax=Motiliproteus sp. TaxID=1898955 RepID=UPI003BAA8051